MLLITCSILVELLKTLRFPLKDKTKSSCLELWFFRKKKTPTVDSFDSKPADKNILHQIYLQGKLGKMSSEIEGEILSERSTSKPEELEYSYCRVEINNQTRSKVSKPNKLGAKKKLLVNIRYFPIFKGGLQVLQSVWGVWSLKLLWPLFHKRWCWFYCPPIPQALRRFTVISKDQHEEGTNVGCL